MKIPILNFNFLKEKVTTARSNLNLLAQGNVAVGENEEGGKQHNILDKKMQQWISLKYLLMTQSMLYAFTDDIRIQKL